MNNREKAASCGEPSYVWRAGQERRLNLILEAGKGLLQDGAILENGCGIGMYVKHLSPHAGKIAGLEFDHQRAVSAARISEPLRNAFIVNGEGEQLPFPNETFDLILSHEVIEHVRDDRQVVEEMVRTLRPGGRIVLFAPNRGYPFETHGIYWRRVYKFGNIPFVNYLPRPMRDRLAPHVRVYSVGDIQNLFKGLPVEVIQRLVIFGAYDNIIARWPRVGNFIRSLLYRLEDTPLKALGLSHFWVVEKIGG